MIGICSRAQTACAAHSWRSRASPASETRKVHPAARTLCFACKYMYCDWDAEPCLTCLRHTLAEAGQADAFEQDQTEKDRLL